MRSVLSLLGLAAVSSAHTVLTNIWVNDVYQGDGTCIRMPHDGSTASAPIASPFSNPDMACGRDGQKAVDITCPATPGSKVTFEFRGYPDYAQPLVIDASHLGPISIYMKSVSSFSDSAAGSGWFKIFEDGYSPETNKWAVDKLIANKGLLSINLPTDLPSGRFLLRTEIITLQNVTNRVVAPQFYSECAQLYIESDNTTPISTSFVSIPGHVSPSDPGLTYDVYQRHDAYTTPGPAVYSPRSSSSSSSTPSVAQIKAITPLSASLGGISPSCLLKNANWCGVEVPEYSNENGCWAAVDNCYAQGKKCYDSAPPTGSRNCDVWEEKKCKVIQAACDARGFMGPPGKGEKLVEVKARTVERVPDVEGGVGGVVKAPEPVVEPVQSVAPVSSEKPVEKPSSVVPVEKPSKTVEVGGQEPTGAAPSAPAATASVAAPSKASAASVPAMPSVYVPKPGGTFKGKTPSPCSRKGKAAKPFRA